MPQTSGDASGRPGENHETSSARSDRQAGSRFEVPRHGSVSRDAHACPVRRDSPHVMNARILRQRELTRVRPITELALPPRAVNALLRGGVNSIGQLISRSGEDLVTEIIGLGEGTLKTIEAALSRENLTLATAQIPSSTFTQISTRRALTRTKTSRHVKNHNAWVNAADDNLP